MRLETDSICPRAFPPRNARVSFGHGFRTFCMVVFEPFCFSWYNRVTVQTVTVGTSPQRYATPIHPPQMADNQEEEL